MEFEMKDLLQIFKPKPLVVKKRGEWIRDFFKALEPGYNNFSSKPLTRIYLAIRMKNVSDAEMSTLWRLCEESKSFDKFFWWRIKKYPPKTKEKKLKQGKLI